MQFLRFWSLVLSNILTPLWKVFVLGGFLFGFWTAVVNQYDWWQSYAVPSVGVGIVLSLINLTLRLFRRD